MGLRKVTFALKAPFGEIGGEWDVDRAEQTAAWEMYVELATRITVVPLGQDQGYLREALSSYYALFGVTREILRRHGPAVARVPRQAGQGGDYSFGYIATWVLNGAIRPILARWHPRLEDWEANRPDGTSRLQHERNWPLHEQLRDQLAQLLPVLNNYAWILAEACDAPALMVANSEIHAPT
ncbi:MAG: hypothetical protein AB7W59_13680 [Acidimicrobiia bacterium]